MISKRVLSSGRKKNDFFFFFFFFLLTRDYTQKENGDQCERDARAFPPASFSAADDLHKKTIVLRFFFFTWARQHPKL